MDARLILEKKPVNFQKLGKNDTGYVSFKRN